MNFLEAWGVIFDDFGLIHTVILYSCMSVNLTNLINHTVYGQNKFCMK